MVTRLISCNIIKEERSPKTTKLQYLQVNEHVCSCMHMLNLQHCFVSGFKMNPKQFLFPAVIPGKTRPLLPRGFCLPLASLQVSRHLPVWFLSVALTARRCAALGSVYFWLLRFRRRCLHKKVEQLGRRLCEGSAPAGGAPCSHSGSSTQVLL